MDPSLANIWDDPIVQDSPKRNNDAADDDDDAPHRPAKRARQTLFLADSDDDDLQPGPSNRIVHKAPPPQNIDIDALFEDVDVDDVEDEFASKPLPAIVDEEELTRQAEANYRRNAPPPLTQYEIMPSSSPSRDTGGPSANKGRAGKDKGDGEKKARKRLIKLDEARLLGENGFPQLIKMTNDFRIKGKGHEATDLDRLLQRYQYWTHQLYPKTTFSDTVDRVEKLCHSRRMNVSLSVWRDDAHGKPAKIPDDDDDDDDEDTNQANADDAMDTENPNSRLPPSSPPRSSPAASSPSRASPNAPTRQPAQPASGGFDDENDEESFWRSMDAGIEASLSDAPPPAPSTGPNSSMDEDEDMWDLVNELEQEAEASAAAAAKPPSVAVAQGPMPQNQPPPDDDFDDMYV